MPKAKPKPKRARTEGGAAAPSPQEEDDYVGVDGAGIPGPSEYPELDAVMLPAGDVRRLCSAQLTRLMDTASVDRGAVGACTLLTPRHRCARVRPCAG